MSHILSLLNKTRTSHFQSYCSDPDLVLELKNLIVVFADTLQVCNYISNLNGTPRINFFL